MRNRSKRDVVNHENNGGFQLKSRLIHEINIVLQISTDIFIFILRICISIIFTKINRRRRSIVKQPKHFSTRCVSVTWLAGASIKLRPSVLSLQNTQYGIKPICDLDTGGSFHLPGKYSKVIPKLYRNKNWRRKTFKSRCTVHLYSMSNTLERNGELCCWNSNTVVRKMVVKVTTISSNKKTLEFFLNDLTLERRRRMWGWW